MALEWKDKVNGEDWVLAEDINAIAKAVRDVENGKLDKPTEAAGIWAVTWENGKQKIKRLATSTGWPYSLPMYDDNSTLKVNDPTLATGNQELACANKKYVDTLGSALSDRTTDLERRMKNVEAAALGNTYLTEEDSSAAYRKIVPLAALPHAGIERLGGAVKGGGGSVTLFESPFAIYNDDEGTLTVDGGAGGEYTFSGAIQNGAQVVLYDVNFPEPIEAGEYEFFFEGDGTAWSIWNVNITVYNADQSDILYEKYVSATNDARMSFTLEEDGIYVLYFSVIPAVGDIGTLTVRPKLVKKGDPIEKSPVTAIENHGKNLLSYPYDAETQTINGITFTINKDGTVTADGTASTNATIYLKNYNTGKVNLPKGTYTVSGSPEGATYDTYRVAIRKFLDGTPKEVGAYTPTAVEMDSYDTVFIQIRGGQTVKNLVFKPQIELGETATAFAPYRAPITYEIPQAVRSLDGYGLGISDTLHNYIDFESQTFVRMVAERAYQEGDISNETMLTDGVTTLYALATPEIVDISDLLTFDGVVEVEGGGEIIAENALALAIPSTVMYQVKI